MKLESQVCSLEWARKLREFGVRQESYFTWYPDDDDKYALIHLYNGKPLCKYAYSAFTVAELGVMLPSGFFSKETPKDRGRQVSLEMWTFGEPMKHCVQYRPVEGSEFCRPFDAVCEENEADARAKMLCYLLENKIISVDEVNKRLREAV